MMEIVIKIPEEDYAILLSHADVIRKRKRKTLEEAVINGKPLPEHHGRLGDLDELYTEMNNGIKAGLYEDGYENYGHINNMDDCLECVEYADTIIEPS